MYTFHDVLVPYVHVPGPMSLDHMYTYQGLCPGIKHILTRAYVLISYVYLPGPMSLDHMYTYQDLCPWIICILTRTYDLRPWIICIHTRTYALGSYVYLPGPTTYVLGSYVYIPGLMPLDHMYILTRTYVLGSYVYLPGLMHLGHMYTYQDLRPWKNNIHTSTRQSHTQTKNNEEKYAQTGRNCGKKMLDTEIGELQIVWQ